MLDKRHIFRRVNFILFISYSFLSIFNDLNITRIPLPIDLSVCIIFFCYRSSFGSFYDFCCLCLRRKCFVYLAGASKNQIPLEDWLRDSVFVFPSPCDLCGLVCILLWLEYLSTCPVCLAGYFYFKTKKIPMCRLL